MRHEITCDGLAVTIDDRGLLGLSKAGARVDCPVPVRILVSGKRASVRSVSRAGRGVTIGLDAEGRGGALRIEPRGDALRAALDIEQAARSDTIRIEVPFASGTTLHVATGRTYGEAIGEKTPSGQDKGIPCVYRPHQIAIAETPSSAVSLIAHADRALLPRDTWGPRWKIGAFNDGGASWAAFETHPGEALEIALNRSLDGAVARHHAHLRNDYGARPWRDAAPAWLADIRMIVTLDMLRSQGEIAHSYAHLAALCRDLKGEGLGGGILFYLPGFHARYDSSFPIYWPAEELGGAAGFREMIETVHACGHRIMPHCMTWGADPCHPFFEEVEDCAAGIDPEEKVEGFLPLGPYKGWPSCMPPVPFELDTGHVPMQAHLDGAEAVVRTSEIPREMEAVLSLAGIEGMPEGRVRARLHGREVYSLPGDLARGGTALRFRLRFQKGANLITLAFSGGVPRLASATYRIHDAIVAKSGGVWTHPIVRMDQTNPRWIAVVRDRIAALVRAFGVDAIHLDAGNVRWGREAPIHWALADALPRTLFGCEYLSELGHFFFHVTQGGTLPSQTPHALTDLGWRLIDPYLRIYYHLCKTEAFVPATKVCDHEPVRPALTPEGNTQANRQWEEAARWHLVPNIRLNYRDYGLDPRSRAAFSEILKGR